MSDIIGSDTPAPPPPTTPEAPPTSSLDDRLAQLPYTLQAQYRVRRQFDQSHTDDEVLDSLLRYSPRSLTAVGPETTYTGNAAPSYSQGSSLDISGNMLRSAGRFFRGVGQQVGAGIQGIRSGTPAAPNNPTSPEEAYGQMLGSALPGGAGALTFDDLNAQNIRLPGFGDVPIGALQLAVPPGLNLSNFGLARGTGIRVNLPDNFAVRVARAMPDDPSIPTFPSNSLDDFIAATRAHETPVVNNLAEIRTGQPFRAQLYRGEASNLRPTARGTFLTPDSTLASEYAGTGSGARVSYGVESFDNPLVFESKKDVAGLLGLRDEEALRAARIGAGGEEAFDEEIAAAARGRGHDAIVYTRGEEGRGAVVDLRGAPPMTLTQAVGSLGEIHNAAGAAQFLQNQLYPALREKFGDAPVVNILHDYRGSTKPLLEVSTAGWEGRLRDAGFTRVGRAGFSDVYAFPEPTDGVILPAKILNTAPDSTFIPPPVKQSMQDFLTAHPTGQMLNSAIQAVTQSVPDAIAQYAGRSYPIYQRLLNFFPALVNDPSYTRNPVVSAAIGRAGALKEVSATVYGYLLRGLSADMEQAFGSTAFTNLRVREGVVLPEGYAPRYNGWIGDIIQHPGDYDLSPKQLAALARHTDFSDMQHLFENENGVASTAVENYLFQSTREINPEGSPFAAIPGMRRIFAKEPFQKVRSYDDYRSAFEAGREPTYTDYGDIMAARSSASADALSRALAQRVAADWGEDSIKSEVASFFSNQGRGALGQGLRAISAATTNVRLGYDLVSVIGNQLPAAILSDLSHGEMTTFKTLASRLFLPSGIDRAFFDNPLQGMAKIQYAIPRFLSPESRAIFMRRNLDTIVDMMVHGSNPVSDPFGLTGGIADHAPLLGIPRLVGNINDQMTAAQFTGLLAPVKINFYRNYVDHLLTAQRSFSALRGPIGVNTANPEGTFLEHITNGPYPKEFVDKLLSRINKDGTFSEYAIKTAVGDHLDALFGGMNPSKMGMSEADQMWDRIVGLAPRWLQANMQLLGNSTRNDLVGQLARDWSLRSLAMYAALGESISLARSGRSMNLTDPTRNDFAAIYYAPNAYVKPMNRLFGLPQAFLSSIVKSKEAGGPVVSPIAKWGFGKLAPWITTPAQLMADHNLYTGQAITRYGQNDAKMQAIYAAQQSLPLITQLVYNQQNYGVYTPDDYALSGLGFNPYSWSPRQRTVFEALHKAASDAGVPEEQISSLRGASKDPLLATTPDGKTLLNDNQVAAARRNALTEAQKTMPNLTYDDIKALGRPTDLTKSQIHARMVGFSDQGRAITDNYYSTLTALAQQRQAAISTGEGLSPLAFREGINAAARTKRMERAQMDAQFNDFVDQNNLKEFLRQTNASGLSKMQEDALLAQAFSSQYNAPELLNPATGAWDYARRDQVRAKWEAMTSSATVDRWLSSTERAVPPLVAAYWHGLDTYKPYFEVQTNMLKNQPPDVQKYVTALDKARTRGADPLAIELLEKAAPEAVKTVDKQITLLKEAMRTFVPGLDRWLFDYGYTPTTLAAQKAVKGNG